MSQATLLIVGPRRPQQRQPSFNEEAGVSLKNFSLDPENVAATLPPQITRYDINEQYYPLPLDDDLMGGLKNFFLDSHEPFFPQQTRFDVNEQFALGHLDEKSFIYFDIDEPFFPQETRFDINTQFVPGVPDEKSFIYFDIDEPFFPAVTSFPINERFTDIYDEPLDLLPKNFYLDLEEPPFRLWRSSPILSLTIYDEDLGFTPPAGFFLEENERLFATLWLEPILIPSLPPDLEILAGRGFDEGFVLDAPTTEW